MGEPNPFILGAVDTLLRLSPKSCNFFAGYSGSNGHSRGIRLSAARVVFRKRLTNKRSLCQLGKLPITNATPQQDSSERAQARASCQ
jgi:hypothetical protein